jgi:hypothetical protein
VESGTLRGAGVDTSNSDPADGSLIDPPDPLIMAKGGDVLAWDIFSQVERMAAEGAPAVGRAAG